MRMFLVVLSVWLLIGALRLAAELLHRGVGKLRRRGHDPGDHCVRPGELPRRQPEAHLSLVSRA